MVDYTRSTGSSGTMMIRDLGESVEFWLRAGAATYAYDLPVGWSYNGISGSGEFRFESGGSWQRVRSFVVTKDQTVTFRIGDSGTSGLGGPTSFSHAIERSTIPSPPSAPRFANLTNTSVDVSFTDGSNGGDAIDARRLGWTYGIVNYVANTVSSDGSTHFHDFPPGATISVWAGTHNSNGWSGYGPRGTIKFDDVPNAPSAPLLSSITAGSVHAKTTINSTNGKPALEVRIGYGTSSSAPQFYKTGSDITITGLTPGVPYYFWAQVRNVYGWGALSARSSTKTPPGVRVNVGGVWKDAVPYVRVNGVWKPAEPYVKDLGIWMKPL